MKNSVNIKNRCKMFGSQLETMLTERARSCSPAPPRNRLNADEAVRRSAMTPEPPRTVENNNADQRPTPKKLSANHFPANNDQATNVQSSPVKVEPKKLKLQEPVSQPKLQEPIRTS